MLAVVGGAVLLLVVLALVLASRRDPEPLVARSCTTPAIALGRAVTGDGRDIAWSVTGPSGGSYAVTVDGASIASPPLSDCAADGTLPPLAAGGHRVELTRDGRTVATARLAP